MARRTAASTLIAATLTLIACGSDESPVGDGGLTDAQQPDTGPAVVNFTDAQLEACVREALGYDKGNAKKQDLLPADLKGLTDLQCPDRAITDLTGLEHAVDLQHLSLWENDVAAIAALASLTKLTSLQLGENKIRDLSPLAKLDKLERLGLAQNKIDDLTALAKLTGLRWLNLDNNPLDAQDLGRLAGLAQLRWLTVEGTKTQGAAPLKPLADRGTQVYMGYAATSAGLPEAAPQMAPGLRPEGELIAAPLPGGALRFGYLTGGVTHPLIPEFSGRVERAGAGLRLRDDGGRDAAVAALLVGRKRGVDQTGATGAVFTLSLELRTAQMVPIAAPAPGKVDKDLMPLVFASPNQFDAGSCLFMANTGAMELLLNQRLADPSKQMKYQGDTDLSERFLMNASDQLPSSVVRYAVTDVIYTYGYLGGALSNKDYPFGAGYVKTLASGALVKADKDDADAEFSCKLNWIDELPADFKSKLVPTPGAERTLIFLDPKLDDKSRWRVALASDDVVERIKWELRTKRAPVVVIYNHYLYWHASVVVGYDDTYTTGGCPMVDSMLQYFDEKGASSYTAAVKAQMSAQGGCSKQGVFYVRDSIYDGTADEPSYSYSDTYSFTKKYAKRIVLRSSTWPTTPTRYSAPADPPLLPWSAYGIPGYQWIFHLDGFCTAKVMLAEPQLIFPL